MMQQFSKIIDCLKRDENYIIMVEDAETNFQFTEICNSKPTANLSGELLIANHGSVEEFFNAIYKAGHEKIRIHFRRKNGSTCKTVGEAKIFDLTGKKAHPEQPAQNETEADMPGLNRAQYQALRYPEIVKERDEYKDKLARAKKKIKKLERAELETKFSTHKSEQNKEMLLGLAPHFAPILAKITAGNGANPVGAIGDIAGMGNPQVDENKIAVMQRINALDETLVYYIGLIAENITDPEVQASVLELVKKHELEPAE